MPRSQQPLPPAATAVYPDDDQPMKKFGTLLLSLRLRAGFSTLETAITAMLEHLSRDQQSDVKAPSKSTLSAYERGDVRNLKSSTLWLLAKTYGTSYSNLAREWAQERLNITQTAAGIVESSTDQFCTLKIDKSASRSMMIITPSQLEALQRGLAPDSIVGVSAMDFLDDDIFFDMVVGNLKNGVRYTYILPSYHRGKFEAFLANIQYVDAELGEQLWKAYTSKNSSTGQQGEPDLPKIQFVARDEYDAPMNYTVIIPADRKSPSRSFIGLLDRERVQYFQVADLYLTRLILNSFGFYICRNNSPVYQKYVKELFEQFERNRRSKQEPDERLAFFGLPPFSFSGT